MAGTAFSDREVSGAPFFIGFWTVMHISSLLEIIQTAAPLAYAASWDKSGVQIASERSDIRVLAVALNPLPSTVEAALAGQADMLLCHHPLALAPRLPDQVDEYHKVLCRCLCGGLWLYSAHTSLDANPAGPVRWPAREMKLKNVRVLVPESGGQEEFGFGFVGDLPQALTWDGFQNLLVGATGCRQWIEAGPRPETVRRVACCPGSGGSLTMSAHKAGADVLVTGDLKYHQALESPVAVVDLGHHSLEERMMQVWSRELERDLAQHGVRTFFIPGRDPMRAVHMPTADQEASGITPTRTEVGD
jgi:dinuclear metal center YbgI/SA1388 family protein